MDLVEYLWDNQIYIDDNTLSVNMTRIREKYHVYYLFPLVPVVIFGGILVFVFARAMLILSFDAPVFLPIQTPIIQAVAVTIAIFIAIYCIYAFIAYATLKKKYCL